MGLQQFTPGELESLVEAVEEVRMEEGRIRWSKVGAVGFHHYQGYILYFTPHIGFTPQTLGSFVGVATVVSHSRQ